MSEAWYPFVALTVCCVLGLVCTRLGAAHRRRNVTASLPVGDVPGEPKEAGEQRPHKYVGLGEACRRCGEPEKGHP